MLSVVILSVGAPMKISQKKVLTAICFYAECCHSKCQRTNENKIEEGFDGNVLLC